MPYATLIGIGCALFCGSIIQGAVGFAFGVFSIPCLVWCGLPLAEAITLVLTVVTFQTAMAAWKYRTHIVWSDVWKTSVFRVAAMPLGVISLAMMSEYLTKEQIKQFLGVAILMVVMIQRCFRPKPKPSLHPIWAVVAGSISGFTAGLVGMGGPPIVLWTAAHDWSTERTRSFLWTIFLIGSALQIGLMIWKFGDSITRSVVLGLPFIPVVVVGTMIGTRIGDRFSSHHLRRFTYAILIFAGLTSLIEPWVSGQTVHKAEIPMDASGNGAESDQ